MEGVVRERLENGLTVLMKPMRSAPIVSVWIWYGVGSRNERPGMTGASHWVEHMLFKGTPSFPKGSIFKSIGRVGGGNNGFTNNDFTVYFETLPREHYELGLRIEADRMVNSVFDPDEVARERTVIISEREGWENMPASRLNEEITATAFQVHPYRFPVIGYKSDLRAMTRDDLYQYYKQFYVPNNATLVIVGDFEPESAMASVARLFGPIPRGEANTEVRSVEPEQVGQRRVEVRRPGNAIYWRCCYHIPSYSHPDRLPLMMLEAVLSGAPPFGGSGGNLGCSTRLRESLVNRKKLAVYAGAVCGFKKDPGLFGLAMMLRDGVSPEKAEKAMFAEIEKLKDKGPTAAEMKKALDQIRAQIEYGRDGIAANAAMLGYRYSMGDYTPIDEVAEQFAAVTAQDVVRVARAYLSERNRTVGVFIPEGAGASGGTVETPRWIPMAIGDSAAFTTSFSESAAAFSVSTTSGGCGFPIIKERLLECGTRVVGIGGRESHCVAFGGFFRGGAAFDPADKRGLSCLAARMLNQGTARRSRKKLDEELDRIAAAIGFWVGTENTGFGGKCLPKRFGAVLKLLRECFEESICPEEEFEKERQILLTQLKADMDSTRWQASRAAAEALYPPGHLYRSDIRGTLETVNKISRDDTLDYLRKHLGPKNMTIVVVGPHDFEAMCETVSRVFGSWKSDVQPSRPTVAEVSSPYEPGERIITMEGKSQCDIEVVRPLVARKHPDYFALCVADMILGRFGLMGRIGEKVRDEMGLAYYAYSAQVFYPWCGEWRISAGVNPANVRKALGAIEGEVKRISSELVSEDELASAKGSMTGSMPLRLDTSESLCGIVKDIVFHELPLDYLQNYISAINAVTAEDVLRVSREYLSRQCVTAIAGPRLQ